MTTYKGTIKLETEITTSETLGWSGEYDKDGKEIMMSMFRARCTVLGKDIARTDFHDTEEKALKALKKELKNFQK